jgi:hypothetical protein
MNNPKVYQALSVLGFLVSAVFTIKLFVSNSTDLISVLAMFSTAFLFECGKYILLYQGIKGPFSQAVKTALLGLWFFVTTASIVASATYVLNDANKNKNLMVENSSAFAKQQNGINVQNDLYSTTKQQIEDLKALQTKQQQEGQAIVNAMPSNYIDRRNQQRASTQALIERTQNQINEKSNSLLGIAAGINKPEKLVISEESTTGGDSFFKLVAQKLNENPSNKNNPYSTEEVGIFFYIAVGIGLELLANLFAFLSQYYKYGGIVLSPTPQDPIKKEIPKIETPKTKEEPKREIESGRLQGMKFKVDSKIMNKIKPKNNVTEFKPRVVEKPRPSRLEDKDKHAGSYEERKLEDDIEKYMQFIIDNRSKNNIAPGRDKIVAGTGLAQERCRTIHGILVKRGYIETGDRCTKIIKEAAISAATNMVVGGIATAVIGGMK